MTQDFDWLDGKSQDELLQVAQDELDAIGSLLWIGKWPSETNERTLAASRATILACRERYRALPEPEHPVT